MEYKELNKQFWGQHLWARGYFTAGKALMERATHKMKLHSQKQLAQRAGLAAKTAGILTKKLLPLRFGPHALLSVPLWDLWEVEFSEFSLCSLPWCRPRSAAQPVQVFPTLVSAEVEAFDPIIRIYATQHGIPEYVDLIKAVMMQESGGNIELVGGDVTQCAEGIGLPVGTPVDPERSLDFGTSIMAKSFAVSGRHRPW